MEEHKRKYKRVPTRVHTRKIDRAVAKAVMSKRYSQYCKAARNKFNKPVHNRYHSKKGANHIAKPVREMQSFFAAEWRQFATV